MNLINTLKHISSRGKRYNLIYADPAWKYDNSAKSKKQWGGAAQHYDVMTFEDIGRLPVASIAAKNCLLAMWWVGPMPGEALYVVEEWGFQLVNMNGFTWHKTTARGKDHFGMGNWTRANSESCLIAIRGKPLRASASVRQLVHAPRREHSRKPDEVRDALVKLCGPVPRIELFARMKAPGWHSLGNQLNKFDLQ